MRHEEAQRIPIAPEIKSRDYDTSSGAIIMAFICSMLCLSIGLSLFSSGDFYSCSRRCGTSHAAAFTISCIGAYFFWVFVGALRQQLSPKA